jgi:uncharacterized coiled-coil protein SlyX
MSKKENPRDWPVSARLTEHELNLVKDDAARRGMNVTDLVRSSLLKQLPGSTGPRLTEIETRITEQDETIFALVTSMNNFRLALAEATEAILLATEKDERNHPAITEWVTEKLRQETPDTDNEPESQQ